jgi:hypothetical protein
VRAALAGAEVVIASDLTLLECDRGLIRAVTLGVLASDRAARLHARLAATAIHWRLMPITREIIARARQPFPEEPIRSLDAIHLASAVVAADVLPDFGVLTLDRRVRAAASELGLRVVPG